MQISLWYPFCVGLHFQSAQKTHVAGGVICIASFRGQQTLGKENLRFRSAKSMWTMPATKLDWNFIFPCAWERNPRQVVLETEKITLLISWLWRLITDGGCFTRPDKTCFPGPTHLPNKRHGRFWCLSENCFSYPSTMVSWTSFWTTNDRLQFDQELARYTDGVLQCLSTCAACSLCSNSDTERRCDRTKNLLISNTKNPRLLRFSGNCPSYPSPAANARYFLAISIW